MKGIAIKAKDKGVWHSGYCVGLRIRKEPKIASSILASLIIFFAENRSSTSDAP